MLPLVTTPRFIEVHRLGAFPERSLDIDVVFDLMIHDLDVILALVKSEVVSIEAVGVPVLTPQVDIANARLRFAIGCIANVTASRISRSACARSASSSRTRTCRSTTRRRKSKAGGWCGATARAPAIEGGQLPVARDEPLKRELADFVDAVRDARRAARRRRSRPPRAGAGAGDRRQDGAASTRHEGTKVAKTRAR